MNSYYRVDLKGGCLLLLNQGPKRYRDDVVVPFSSVSFFSPNDDFMRACYNNQAGDLRPASTKSNFATVKLHHGAHELLKAME